MRNFLNNLKVCLYIAAYLSLMVVLLVPYSLAAKTIVVHNLAVTKVIDGDTIWVRNSKNVSYKIRFLGINAPETSTTPVQPFAIAAKTKLTTLLNQQKVYIVYDSKKKTDKYKRILAQIYREKDNLWLNSAMVQAGLVYVYIISPNISKLDQLIKIENKAMASKTNIWSNKNYAPISPQSTVNFVGQYKVIIGKINKVNITNKSIWLEFASNNNIAANNTFINYPNYILKANYTVLISSSKRNEQSNNILKQNSNSVFAVRIDKKSSFANKNWQKLLGKTIKVRGYIDQYNKRFSPFVNLINQQTIEIVNKA